MNTNHLKDQLTTMRTRLAYLITRPEDSAHVLRQAALLTYQIQRLQADLERTRKPSLGRRLMAIFTR